jgi:glycerol-3-phosphate O-acyltransferase
MDLLGNYVDDDGTSLDKYGNRIEERDYFKSNGQIVEDLQREGEYTVMLSKRIVEEFHRINRVFSSHLVAFTAFELFRKQYSDVDFYTFLRYPEEDLVLPYNQFRKKYKKLRKRIFKLKERDKVDVADHLSGKTDATIQLGINNVGMYHNLRPLLRNKDGDIITQDLTVLYFYRNRLDGYGLEKYI